MTLEQAAQLGIDRINAGTRPGWVELGRKLGVSPEKIRSKARWMMSDVHKQSEPLQSGKVENLTWRVIDSDYVWDTIHGAIKIPVESVDEMFFQYSRHGMNKSSTQMMQDWGLEPWEWHSLKSRLRLYKDAHIFSPYTVEITPLADMEQMVERKMSDLYQKTHVIVEKAYNRQTLQEARKIIYQEQKKRVIADQVVDALESELASIKVHVPQVTVKDSKIERLYVVISDLHIGIEGKEPIIRDRLSMVAEEVLSLSPKAVSVIILGDIIESFTGTNKNDTWQNLSLRGFGSQIVMTAVDIITGFVATFASLDAECYCVPGNHDRMTSSKKDDPVGQIGLLIYEFCRRLLPGVQFYIEPDVCSFPIDDRHDFVALHGDKGFSRKTGLEIKSLYGTREYTLVLRGHYHHRQIQSDTDVVRYITVPGIVGETPYSESIGERSPAGFMMFYTKDDRLITIDQTL